MKHCALSRDLLVTPRRRKFERRAYPALAEWESYKRKYGEDSERALLLEEARRHIAAVRRRAGRTRATASQGEEGPAGSGLPAGEEAAPDGQVGGRQIKSPPVVASCVQKQPRVMARTVGAA